jgi:hypothetical protein
MHLGIWRRQRAAQLVGGRWKEKPKKFSVLQNSITLKTSREVW